MEELMKEAQEFVRKRDITYKEPEKKAPTLKPNTKFLKNVIVGNTISNKLRNAKRRKESGSGASKPVESRDAKRLKTS